MKLFQKVSTFTFFVSAFFLFHASIAQASIFTDTNCASEFDNGTHNNTVCAGGNMKLDATGLSNGSGVFTSRVFNTQAVLNTFSFLSWASQYPYGKELVDYAQNESGYTTGNISMESNVLLLHLNSNSTWGEGLERQSFVNTATYSTSFAECWTTDTCPVSADGKLSYGYNFDGVNDLLVVSSTSELQLTNAFTVSAWVKQDTAGDSNSDMVVVGKESGSKGYLLRTGGRKVEVSVGDGSSWHTLTASSTFSLGTWHHIAATLENNVLKVYLDGYLDGMADQGSSTVIATSTSLIAIGNSPADSSRAFDGTLDEVAVFNSALTADDILNMYIRGALNVRYQIKICDTSNCSGGYIFTGPNNTGETYYSELLTLSESAPMKSIGQSYNYPYIQYKMYLDTASTTLSPQIESVSIYYNIFSTVPEGMTWAFIGGAMYIIFVMKKKYLQGKEV